VIKIIDLNAPIIPHEGLGGIKLYSHINDVYKEFINKQDVKFLDYGKCSKIEIGFQNYISLGFCKANGKLYAISARKDYKGLLWDRVYVGMPLKELLAIEPSFKFDEDWEEGYISKKYDLHVEDDVETGKIIAISIRIKECKNKDFWEGNW
jgi:hypothetical protein